MFTIAVLENYAREIYGDGILWFPEVELIEIGYIY
jgi:hypothetical protein